MWMRAISLLLLVLPFSLSGQSFVDLVKLDYKLSPDNAYEDSSNAGVDIRSLDLNILLPIVSKDSSFTTLVGAGYSDLRFDGEDFYSATLQVGGKFDLTKGYSFTAIALPKLSADRSEVGAGDAQLGAYLLLSRDLREDFTWKLGAYLNGDRFGPLTVPVLGLRWQMNPSTQLDLSLPLAGTFRKTFSETFLTGLVFSGRRYSFNYTGQDRYLEVSENNLFAFADVYLSPSLVLNLRAGHSILRDYQRFDDSERMDLSLGPANIGDERVPLNASLGQGITVQGGLIWRYGL